MKALKIALCCGALMALSALYSPTVKAQEKDPVTYDAVTGKATTAEVQPIQVFTGAEQNKKDSLLSIAKAATDPAVKDVIQDTIKVLEDTPQKGGISEYIAYIIGALGALSIAWNFFKGSWQKKADTSEDYNSDFR